MTSPIASMPSFSSAHARRQWRRPIYTFGGEIKKIVWGIWHIVLYSKIQTSAYMAQYVAIFFKKLVFQSTWIRSIVCRPILRVAAWSSRQFLQPYRTYAMKRRARPSRSISRHRGRRQPPHIHRHPLMLQGKRTRSLVMARMGESECAKSAVMTNFWNTHV